MGEIEIGDYVYVPSGIEIKRYKVEKINHECNEYLLNNWYWYTNPLTIFKTFEECRKYLLNKVQDLDEI